MQLDISLLKSSKVKNGLSDSDLDNPELLPKLQEINQSAQNNNYGFINILKNQDLLDQIKKVHQQFTWAKHLVVVGIGGSDLGARTLQKSLQNNNFPVSFIGDSTDPYPYYQLFSNLDLEETAVNIISKSGSTTETSVGFLLLKDFYQKQNLDWTKHFIFTTDPQSGILHDLAQSKNIPTLPVPQDIDGRFSVLSAVGLFPALFMGIDIIKLVNSAAQFTDKLILDNSSTNPAWQFALQNYLFSKEKNIHNLVIMPYAARLDLFADWFRQIWAESLGKDGNGFLPIKAVGPADQHSQLQYYNQGKNLNTYFFITLKNYTHNQFVNNTEINDLSFLHQKDLQTIIQTECDATRFSLASNGRPSSHLILDTLDETSLGSLFLFFEIATVYAAKLLNVNFSEQPGVEQSKQYIYSLLDKPGFEQYKQELNKYL